MKNESENADKELILNYLDGTLTEKEKQLFLDRASSDKEFIKELLKASEFRSFIDPEPPKPGNN